MSDQLARRALERWLRGGGGHTALSKPWAPSWATRRASSLVRTAVVATTPMVVCIGRKAGRGAPARRAAAGAMSRRARRAARAAGGVAGGGGGGGGVTAHAEIEDEGAGHERHHGHAHGEAHAALLEILHDAPDGRESEGAAAGQHDPMR